MAAASEYLAAMQMARGGWNRKDFSAKRPVIEEKIGIASDVHIPYHNERLLAQMLQDFADHHVEAIVWLGDFFDLPYFSRFDQIDKGPEWQRDREIGETILRLSAQIVKVQYMSRGNHDYRALAKMLFQINMTDLMRMVGVQDLIEEGKLIVSDNPSWSYMDDTWLLTHPDQYGSQPLVVPGKIADLEHRNVVAGHAHHFARGFSPSGRYRVIESGGLYDARYFEYVQQKVTAARKMCSGYWILDKGQPLGFDKAVQ